MISLFFFFNDTATTEIYTLSLHDALPIFYGLPYQTAHTFAHTVDQILGLAPDRIALFSYAHVRSEEHTSELQSLAYLVCRLLLEKKKKIHSRATASNTCTLARPGTTCAGH